MAEFQAVEFRSRGDARKPLRYPRINYARELFCTKWGPASCCRICQQSQPPQELDKCGIKFAPRIFGGVGREMRSLDYFTVLPNRVEGRCPGIREPETFGQQLGVLPNQCAEKDMELGLTATPAWSISSSLESQSAKPNLIRGGSVCRTSVPDPPVEAIKKKFICDEPSTVFDISPELPFKVCIGDFKYNVPPRMRTGVERCLQPSRYRYIDSTYREAFKDFMRMYTRKTKEQILLYRTPLVIDNRRAGPKIPCDSSSDLVIGVNSGPIPINAKQILYHVCKPKREPQPSFKVILPGPITIPYITDCKFLNCKSSL